MVDLFHRMMRKRLAYKQLVCCTEEDVSGMLEELADRAASRQQPPPTHVDLHQFLALYLNYRPALQDPSDEVSQAFAALGADPATGM